MVKIIPLHPESYDEIRARFETMEIDTMFAEWLLIKDAEIKEALKVYVRKRMMERGGIDTAL